MRTSNIYGRRSISAALYQKVEEGLDERLEALLDEEG